MKRYILPFRDFVVQPGLTVPMFLDNATSIACVEAAVKQDQQIVLVAQKTSAYPSSPSDIYPVGVIANIAQVLTMPDNTVHAIFRTTDPVEISDITVENNLFQGEITPITLIDDTQDEMTIALRDRILEQINSMPAFRRGNRAEKMRNLVNNYPLAAFVDAVIQITNLDTNVALEILRAQKWRSKLMILLEQIGILTEAARIEESINRKVQQQMERGQREAILQEKMRALQREMGEDTEDYDAETLRQKIKKSGMPKETQEKAMSEWRRMRNMPQMSPEGSLLRAYLDELLSMPWGICDKTDINLQHARQILDSQHSGMQDVKERILEHIAVMKKTGTNAGTTLCLVGSPGVGKTSLCKSIADALGRKYVRISLGGVSDESHLRGHRKTYVASQPGRIMDALKRCKTSNPVIVLDEIDKMGKDGWHGSPESALLEVLDPEQNKTFRDHYLEVGFDLSNVLFIATANSLNMSPALRDRMEIIKIPAYTTDEKLQITREHLIARSAHDTGWDIKNIDMDDTAVRHIISNYTSEDGVRQLQREITAILRRSLLENDGEDIPTKFTPELIDKLMYGRNTANMGRRIGFSARA